MPTWSPPDEDQPMKSTLGRPAIWALRAAAGGGAGRVGAGVRPPVRGVLRQPPVGDRCGCLELGEERPALLSRRHHHHRGGGRLRAGRAGRNDGRHPAGPAATAGRRARPVHHHVLQPAEDRAGALVRAVVRHRHGHEDHSDGDGRLLPGLPQHLHGRAQRQPRAHRHPAIDGGERAPRADQGGAAVGRHLGLRGVAPVGALRADRRHRRRADRRQPGLGYLLADAAGQFNTAGVFAALLAIVLLALCLNLAVKLFEYRAMPWQRGQAVREMSI